MTLSLTATERAEIIDALNTGDDETYKLSDGRALHLHIMPDDFYVDDLADMGDTYGHTEWTCDNDYGPVRPRAFTGRAEILKRDGWHSLWWEPYFDKVDGPIGYRGTPEFRAYRQHVLDILEYGFLVMVLELLEGEDAYHRPIVRRVASIGGIEPFADDAYRATIVSDLLLDIESEESRG